MQKKVLGLFLVLVMIFSMSNISVNAAVLPGDGYIQGCDTYNLDESTIKWIATCVTGEGGETNLEECRRYASHAANLHEVYYGRSGRDSDAIRNTVKKKSNGGWYANASWTRGCSDEAIQAVKEVFLEGKRFLPRYVTEFDTFPNDIVSPKKRNEYKIGDTIINVYADNKNDYYQFYMFFDCGDIAGYFQRHFDKFPNDNALLNGGKISDDVKIKLNGFPMNSGAGAPFVNYEGRTMVPLRAFAETVGYEVGWNDSTKEITLKHKTGIGNIVIFQIGSYDYKVKFSEIGTGAGKNMDTCPIIYGERTYIPLRYAAEALGYKVDWNDLTKTANCTK